MKKFYICCGVILIATLCSFADHDDRFNSALKNCTPYVSNGVVDTAKVSADYKSQIVGWENDKCVFKKIVNFTGGNACITCRFSQEQIKELTDVMNAYKTLQQYSEDDIDITNPDAVKNNPVVKAWNKYLLNPEVCSMNIGQE